jgi:hypothetical protein
MTSYKAHAITINEWREIYQVPEVWKTFMDHPERLSVHELTDFVFGAKFFPFGVENSDTELYTLMAVFPKSQVSLVLERIDNGPITVKAVEQ